MRTPYQTCNAPPMMNGGRGQRMARMLQMQGQSQQVSNNAGAQTDMQYSPPQNAADMKRAPGQFLRQYPKMPKSPGMTNPQGGPDRGGFENG